MGPSSYDTDDDARQALPDFDGVRTTENIPSNSVQSHRSPSESRLEERLERLLRQRRTSGAVMLGVLSVALLFGLIGFAADFLWIVAVIVMALGLGFIFADSRRDRIDLADQRSEQAASDKSQI
jgi:hypothetical protein